MNARAALSGRRLSHRIHAPFLAPAVLPGRLDCQLRREAQNRSRTALAPASLTGHVIRSVDPERASCETTEDFDCRETSHPA